MEAPAQLEIDRVNRVPSVPVYFSYTSWDRGFIRVLVLT